MSYQDRLQRYEQEKKKVTTTKFITRRIYARNYKTCE